MNILVINVMGLYSYGGRAVIRGFVESVRAAMPGARITFMLSHYREEAPVYERWDLPGVSTIDHAWYRETGSPARTLVLSGARGLALWLSMLVSRPASGAAPPDGPYGGYDVIVDLTTDGPNDHYRLSMTLFSLFNTYLATLSGRPTVVSAASIGTFRRWSTKHLAAFVLNRVDEVCIRETRTLDYLETLGISGPRVHLTADLAFLMDPAPEARVDEILAAEGLQEMKKPVFGVTPSYIIHRYAFPGTPSVREKERQYYELMTRIIRYINEKYECTVLLIPHSAARTGSSATEDDKSLSRALYEGLREHGGVRLVAGDYDTDELKGIIGRCDLFLGCRMHATIAAVSTYVPTVALVYGHKSHGILGEMLGMEENIIAVEDHDPESLHARLVGTIDAVWQDRDALRAGSVDRVASTKERARLNGEIIRAAAGRT